MRFRSFFSTLVDLFVHPAYYIGATKGVSMAENASIRTSAVNSECAERVPDTAILQAGFLTGACGPLKDVRMRLAFEGNIYNVTVDRDGRSEVKEEKR